MRHGRIIKVFDKEYTLCEKLNEIGRHEGARGKLKN